MPAAATLAGPTIRQKAKAARGASKDVVKPVLANPFTVPWPALPNHLQSAVLAALPAVLPADVATYHVSRQRCSRALKRRRKNQAEGKDADEVAPPPPRPVLLDELVFGLSETIKAVERGIDNLRVRMMVMTDALAGQHATPAATARLLPTAPSEAPAASPAPMSPLAYVLVPHLSVSPQALIDPLPAYCATYNALVRQHAQLVAEVRNRLPLPDRFATPAGPEIRLVPLGKREAEISAMIGLRRVSTFAVRNAHSERHVLDNLLPNSVLPPPRHSITLPFPTSTLTVHADPLPTPAVQYAPLHVKAIQTTAPIDTGARKNARLIEVRTKRIENKEKRREARAALERAAIVDIRRGKPGGRATRLAKKAAMDVDVAA